MANGSGHRLDEEQKVALCAEIKNGAGITALAKKYKVSDASIRYHRDRVLGLPGPPSRPVAGSKAKEKVAAKSARKSMQPVVVRDRQEVLEAMNADITSGQYSIPEIAQKYRVAESGVWKRKKDMAKAARPRPELTPERRDRIIGIFTRIGEREPSVFLDLFDQMLSKHRDLIVEVL